VANQRPNLTDVKHKNESDGSGFLLAPSLPLFFSGGGVVERNKT